MLCEGIRTGMRLDASVHSGRVARDYVYQFGRCIYMSQVPIWMQTEGHVWSCQNLSLAREDECEEGLENMGLTAHARWNLMSLSPIM